MALGRSPDIAINHDAEALAMHAVNHPNSLHLCEDVWAIDPRNATAGRRVGLMWLSPDCKHFSKAKGGKPVEKKIRGLAWIAVKWAKAVRPRVIVLENVEEFADWGPLLEDGRPCPLRKGLTFRRFVKQLQNAGYIVDWQELIAADFGSPTTRKRLFLIARADGIPITWPQQTHDQHARGALPKWRAAAECIDWAIPCPSIFERARPLAENTLRRISRGIKKYVIDAARPFIVPIAHYNGRDTAHSIDEPLRTVAAETKGGEFSLVTPFIAPLTHQGSDRVHGVDEPMRTVTGAHRGEQALIAPVLVGAGGPAYSGKPVSADKPFGVLTTENHRAVVAAHISPFYGIKGNETRGTSPDDPLQTQTGDPRFGIVGATLIQTGYGEREGQLPRVPGIDKPLGTVVGGGQKHALVAAFMAQHNGGFYDTSGGAGRQADLPLSTITHSGSQQQVVASTLVNLRGTQDNQLTGRDIADPLPTISGGGIHAAEVRAFLMKYHATGGQWNTPSEPMPTVMATDSIGLVTVAGQQYQIADIGMRMLQPRELFRAQGFPDTYRIDADANGKPFTKSAQVRMCGNSVCPPVAAAILMAQFAILESEAVA